MVADWVVVELEPAGAARSGLPARLAVPRSLRFTVPERVDNLVITCECAHAENPSPPYSLGMIIPKKPLSLMYCHTCGGRSL